VTDVVPLRLTPPDGFQLVDQTLLPAELRYLRITSVEAACEAIAALRVRGAPLLGIAGAAAMAVAAERGSASDSELAAAGARIASTRPTAVDLGTRIRQALETVHESAADPDQRRSILWAFARRIIDERLAEDRQMADHGMTLFVRGDSVLTHCNTGALATGGIGSALGVICTAWEAGLIAHCYVTETRPLLQGARLTMWELDQLKLPATLLPDTAAASLIASGRVQAVFTGADRIAANGDTANKVGTYGLAAVAARHSVPFYVAAPLSTFDPRCPDGSEIPIEYRAAEEVGGFAGQRWSPDGSTAYNPAFDVTPAELIAALVTERGILRPPFGAAIAALRQA